MREVTIDGVSFREVPDVSEYVMVRTYSAGVHYGILKERNGREVTLTDSRRVYSWSGGALTLNELSQTGPSGGKVSKAVPSILLLEAIEVIPMAAAAVVKLGEFTC